MRKIEQTVYSFDELSKDAQNNAISNHIQLWLDIKDIEEEKSKNSNFYKAFVKSEEMRTPWFLGSYVYEYCRDDIVAELKEMELEFYPNGKIYSETEYLLDKLNMETEADISDDFNER